MAKKVVIQVLADVASAVANFGKVDSALGKMSARARSAGGAIAGFGRNATLVTTVPIVGALGAALKVASDFEASLLKLQATSGATGEQFTQLREQAKALGATTKFSASQAAEAQNFLAMAGFSTDQIYKALPSTLNLAAAGALDLGKAADIASNIMSGFGLDAKETGRVTDVLAQAARNANTDIGQLGYAMKYAAPIAKAAGFTLEETAAAIGKFSDAGIQGSSAGTGFRQIINKLINPSTEAANIMAKYALSINEAQGNLRPLNELLVEFQSKGVSTADTLAILGTQGGSAFLALKNQGVDSLVQLQSKLENANGTAKQMADTMSGGLAGGMASLNSAAEGLAIAIGETGLLNYAAELVGYATQFVRWLSTLNPNILRTAVVVAGVVAVVAPLITILGTTITAVGAIGGAVSAILPVLSAVGAAIGVVVGAVGAVPLAITAAVAATAVGVWNLYHNWDTVCKYVVAAGKGLRDWFANNWREVGLFIASPIGWAIKKFYESFSQARGAGQGFMQALTQGIWDVATAPVNAIKDIVGQIRAYLPGSDARVGALSDLTASGRALPSTFASGMNSGTNSIQQASAAIASTAAPTPSIPSFAGIGSGSSTTTINFQPTITLSGSATQDDARRILNTLEEWATELNSILDRNRIRGNRV